MILKYANDSFDFKGIFYSVIKNNVYNSTYDLISSSIVQKIPLVYNQEFETIWNAHKRITLKQLKNAYERIV